MSQISPTNKQLVISPSNAAHKTLLSKPLTPLLRLGNHQIKVFPGFTYGAGGIVSGGEKQQTAMVMEVI